MKGLYTIRNRLSYILNLRYFDEIFKQKFVHFKKENLI